MVPVLFPAPLPGPYLDHKKQFNFNFVKKPCRLKVNRSSIFAQKLGMSSFAIPFYHGSGSAKAKVTVPTVPFPQHCFLEPDPRTQLEIRIQYGKNVPVCDRYFLF
jgi:hypothetical protein